MDLVIAKKGEDSLPPTDENAMYRLRCQVFRDRLNWDVRTSSDLEFDAFDQLNASYLIAKENGVLYGCARLLPTTGPNMLRDVFPELLGNGSVPSARDTWELSRLAILQQQTLSFGLSSLPLKMIEHMVHYVRTQGVKQLVTVTTLSLERLLKHAGLIPQRLGPILKIGMVHTVALSFEINELTEIALANAIMRASSSPNITKGIQ